MNKPPWGKTFLRIWSKTNQADSSVTIFWLKRKNLSWEHITVPSTDRKVFLFMFVILSSVQFSPSVMFYCLQRHGLQYIRPPCPSLTPGVYSNSCQLSQWCHPTISSSVAPFYPACNLSQHQGLFQWVNSSHEVAKVHHSFQRTPRSDLLQNGLVGSPCSPRDSQ